MNGISTKDRLLRAAASEVARHGIKGASLRRIAEGADIRAASIFHYFPGGKDALIEAMLTHIMQTIASRMTPTISAGSDLPPVELIVRCTAQLWDFMQEHPEYAGALMREALVPDDHAAEMVRANADEVIGLATAYISSAQDDGLLAPGRPRRLLMHIATFVMTFHAAPSMRRTILGDEADEERDAFLDQLRRTISVD